MRQDQGQPIEITVEDVDKLLEVARWLKAPPELPPRKDDLWQQAVAQGRARAIEGLRERARQIIGRPGDNRRCRPTKIDPKSVIEPVAIGWAETLYYRELDPAYARAEDELKRSIDQKIREFYALVRPLRETLESLSDMPARHTWVYKPTAYFTYDEDLSPDGWRRAWREVAPWLVQDLEGIKRVIERQRAADAVRSGLSASKAGDDEGPDPSEDHELIHLSAAAGFYNIPKSLLSKRAGRSPNEFGYLWSVLHKGRRYFRRDDLLRLSRSRHRPT